MTYSPSLTLCLPATAREVFYVYKIAMFLDCKKVPITANFGGLIVAGSIMAARMTQLHHYQNSRKTT
jgi:hypothetical protein